MPRPKRDSKPQPNGFVASAARLTGKRLRIPKNTADQGWQADAWNMRDAVGELRAVDSWVTNTLSQVRLYITEDTADGPVPVTSPENPAVQALAALFNGQDGQQQMLGAMASHLTFPGETWLVGLLVDPPYDDIDRWRVLSNEEVSKKGARWQIDLGDGNPETYAIGDMERDPPVEPEALVIRIWRPHPRKSVEADSPVRAALPILRELVGIDQHVGATIDSRLAGAGILLLPSEITFSTPTVDGVPGTDVDVDAFTSLLTEAMVTPIGDRGNPSAVVPLVVKAPGALLANVQHLKFDTPFSERALELRQEDRQRLAITMDMPPEALTGMGDVNHWTGWLVSEEGIKNFTTPLANLIAQGITQRYIWPALQGDAVIMDPVLRRYRVGVDTSALRMRPERTDVAMQMHDGLEITDAALARETGMTGDLLDRTSDEYRRRLLEKVALTQPALAADALLQLGFPVAESPDAMGAPGPTPVEAPAAPPAVEAPRNPPEQQAATLLLGAEAVVMRALERAWNRAGKRSRGPRRPVPPEQLEACLHGAWDYLPRAAALCGVDQQRLQATLDTYTRSLLATGSEHDPMVLDQLLRDRVLTPLVSTGG